jgi:hypothetical protein
MVRAFPSFVKSLFFCGSTLLAGAGCAAETSDSAPADRIDPAAALPSEADELREQTLKLAGASSLTVTDSPVLKAGASGALACSDRFAQDGRERITCTRDKELLEVILHTAEKTAVVIHRASGRSGAATFFTCKTSGNGPGSLPASLSCGVKAPTSSSGHGGLASPFASTAPGIRIQNAHPVGSGGMVFRGMAPRSADDYADLASAGIGAVLVFKNQTGQDDVGEEITALTAHGLAPSKIVNIPFKWKDIGTFSEPCTQTVEALKFIAMHVAAHEKTFFHCTVGEDRTGLLAAMHRLLNEPALTAATAFDEEMCERGYAAGNPLKPAFVTSALDHGLTPLYRKLAYLVANGKLRAGALDASVCAADPETDATFAASALPLARLKCGASTRFEP